MDKLVLIDGNSIVNRAFYGVPDLTNKEGLHTNAIYGFLNILIKVIEEESNVVPEPAQGSIATSPGSVNISINRFRTATGF